MLDRDQLFDVLNALDNRKAHDILAKLFGKMEHYESADKSLTPEEFFKFIAEHLS